MIAKLIVRAKGFHMTSQYHLIATSSNLNIGDVNTVPSGDGKISYSVDKTNSYKGVSLLFDPAGNPIFEVNAFILSRRIVEGLKDTQPSSFAMLSYFRFLDANNIKWNETNHHLKRYPIFLFRNNLENQIEKGNYSRETAKAFLSVVRRFYMFCYRHGYISELPFDIQGVTKYGQNITDCSIRGGYSGTKLRPLDDLDVSHVRNNWESNGLSYEFRLAISLAITTGLRAVEISDIKRDHFCIPKGFDGKTLTGIRIGPGNDCKTKYDLNREISMPVWLMKTFNNYHETSRYKDRATLFYQATGSINIPALLTKSGNPFNTQMLNVLWGKLRKTIRQHDNKHFSHRLHDLRATFGANKLETLLNLGSLTTTQALAQLKSEMGHKDLATTMRYLTYWEGNPEKNMVPEVMTNILGDIGEEL